MNAGRKLDTLVHERVMGVVWDESRCRVCGWAFSGVLSQGCIPGNCSMRPPPRYQASEAPTYSTDIGNAARVVEKLRNEWAHGDDTNEFWTIKDCGLACDGWRVEVEFTPDHDGPVVEHFALSESLPHAICLAALKAVGVEV